MRAGRLQVLFSIPKMAVVDRGRWQTQKWWRLQEVLLSIPKVVALGRASQQSRSHKRF